MPRGSKLEKRRPGRPVDPTCGADPAELVRHPIRVLESNATRAERLCALLGTWRMPREVGRLKTVSGALRALKTSHASGWVVAAEATGGSTRGLLARIRAEAPTMPLYVNTPEIDDAVNLWCLELGAAYLPGELEPDDAAAILDRVERYEVSGVSSRAFAVRRAQPRRLRPHEVDFAVEYLDGSGTEDEVAQRLRLTDASGWSTKSRTASKLGLPPGRHRLQALLRERRAIRAEFAGSAPAT